MNLPVICNNCGTLFPLYLGEGFGATITMTNSTAGPCPNCGGSGQVLDGTYKFVENVISVLSAPQRTLDELQKLSDSLKVAQNKGYTNQELKNHLEKDVPELSSIADLFPKTREEKRSDLHFIITTILAVLAIVIPLMSNGRTSNTEEIKTEQVIQNIYHIENQTIVNYPQQTTHQIQKSQEPVRVNKVGRNEPCPCGSGLKYKKCHGY